MLLTKEEQLFFRHMADLSETARFRDIEMFSDFLSVRETAILNHFVADLPSGRFFLFGGIPEAERRMACFLSSYTNEEEISFPISCVKISVLGFKFLRKSLKHSDFLGAVLGIGIERRLIGDILVSENGSFANLFCTTSILSFLLKELTTVGSATVICEECSLSEISMSRRVEEAFGSVPSLRLDAIVGEVYHLSRSKAKALFDAEKIIINGAVASSIHLILKSEDVISVRGHGKFIFYEALGNTKKNKIRIRFGKYF